MKHIMPRLHLISILTLLAHQAPAAMSVSLSGNTESETWSNLTAVAHPGYPTYQIHWEHGVHDQLYALQLDSSDTFNLAAIPEPSALCLASVAGIFLLRRRRG